MSESIVGRWIAATRPKTLPIAVSPVVAGIALAVTETGQLAWIIAAATLLCAIGIQIGTNLYNDASDFERGTDTDERVGPARATAQGWFTARQVKAAAHLTFLAAFLIGVLLSLFRGGWEIFLLGVTSLAAGYAYTSGPRPIAYGPFGELFVLLFFGIAAVTGSYYLQTLTFGVSAVLLGIAIGLPAAAVLLLNNYRDLETDRLAGRRTLCHYLERPGARIAYAVFMLAPIPIYFLMPFPGQPWPVLAGLPIALVLIRKLYKTPSGPALNPMLGMTAGYQVGLMLLVVLGFALP